MLLDAARGHVRGSVLDLCTGSGVIALSVARAAERVTAVDSSLAAVLAVRLGALANGVAVDALRGDLFEPVAGRRFDLILTNPPYLPTASPPAARGARAWDGGSDGRAVLDRICREAPAHLRPGGDVFLVQSSLADIGRTIALLAAGGLEASVALSHRGPLGPLAHSQAAHLCAIGALADGDTAEEIAVVRGTRPRAQAPP
jgi:release factor glutamine methyltransferase